MINPNSAHAYEKISFRHGMTQVEKVKHILDICGPQSDRELSEKTGIPRHLMPARRGQLVKLGVVKRLKSIYDQVTRQTVDVWATTHQVDKIESQRAAEAVRKIMSNAQKEAVQVITGGLFALALFFVVTPHVEAAKITRKTVIKSKFALVQVTPTTTPTIPKTKSNLPALTVEKFRVKELVCKYFGNECQTASAVFFAESGLRCEAVGDTSLAYLQDGVEYGKSYGVAQIRHLPGRPDPATLLDCESNIRHAYGMWKAQGWYPWSAYTNKSYLSYL